MRPFRSFAAPLAVIGLALAAHPALAVQRAFVASYGSDANVATNCVFANPCRGFTAALTVVDSGGEIVALDAAGYGAVTINKAVIITANPGFYAGVFASAGNAVTIDTAGVHVILRGLNINGIGAPYGIFMSNGAILAIENCVISNFTTAGIYLTSPEGQASPNVRVVNSLVRGNYDGIYVGNGVLADIVRTTVSSNGDVGIFAENGSTTKPTIVSVADSSALQNGHGFVGRATTGATTRMSLTRSTAANNTVNGFYALGAGGTTVLTVGTSMAMGNAVGFINNGATFESLGNNQVRQNTTDTSGTITLVSGQ